jgi:hypothetical protein
VRSPIGIRFRLREHRHRPSEWDSGFGLLRPFDPRPLGIIGLRALLTHTTTSVPLVVPALVLAVRGMAEIGWRWWALAAPLTVVGVSVAEGMWRAVERPTRDGVGSFVALAGFVAPALTRILALSLRYRSP